MHGLQSRAEADIGADAEWGGIISEDDFCLRQGDGIGAKIEVAELCISVGGAVGVVIVVPVDDAAEAVFRTFLELEAGGCCWGRDHQRWGGYGSSGLLCGVSGCDWSRCGRSCGRSGWYGWRRFECIGLLG